MLSCTKVAVPLIFGILIGASLSLLLLPFLEEKECKKSLVKQSPSEISTTGSKANRHDHLSHGIDIQSFRDEKYQPNLIKSNQNEENMAKRPFRHRFASSEIDIMETLFIGYLSSAQQLSGRIDALNKTLVSPSSGFTASVKFFIEGSQSSHNKLNSHPSLVKLNLLQPNTLPLLTIKYMTTLRSKYKYFMLVPDSVYVIPSTLSEILQGRENRPYLGFVSSASSQCDLSSGIMLSRTTLFQVAKKMEECEQLFKTNSNSLTALDECIKLATSTKCEPLEQHLQEYKAKSNELVPNGVHIISGITTKQQILNIRRSLAKAEIKDTVLKIMKLADSAKTTAADWPPAARTPFHTSNRFDVIRWTLVSDNTSYLEYDLVNSQPLQVSYMKQQREIIESVMSSINKLTDRYRLIKMKQCYYRADPTRGIDYFITLSLYDRISDLYETRLFEVATPLTQFKMRHVEVNPETTLLHIAVPVYEATTEDLESLLSTFFLSFNKDPHLHLHLTLIYSDEEHKQYRLGYKDVFGKVKEYVSNFRMRYKLSQVIQLRFLHGQNVTTTDITAQLANEVSSNSVIFTSTLSTRLFENITTRIRHNVHMGRQAYAPIAFWQYDSSLVSSTTAKDMDIARSTGHFDNQWFEHIAFFTGDFLRRWKEETNTKSLYKLLLGMKDFQILRSPDPDCIVRYKKAQCNRGVFDIPKCLSQNMNNVGSASLLAVNLLQAGNMS